MTRRYNAADEVAEISVLGLGNLLSPTAGARRRCGFPIFRWLFSAFCGRFIGRSCGFPVGFSASVSRLLTRAFDSLLCLFSYGLAALLGFLAYRLRSLFCFLADRL